MITISKDASNTDPYSSGDESDPATVAITLDGSNSPTTVSASPATDLYVYAEDDTGSIGSYSSITIAPDGSDTGITWTVSTDNVTFTSSINISDMDVSSTAQATQIYLRGTAVNDGSLTTGNYGTPNLKITYTENPD